MSERSVASGSTRTEQVARWLASAAQLALMLLAFDGGVRPIEWFATLVPGAGWLAYLVTDRRWAAGVALGGMLALVPVSLDWLTRAALATWALYLAWVVLAAPRVRLAASLALGATAVRTFEQLRFTSGRVELASILSLFFWLAYVFYFYVRSREGGTQPTSILELS
jgi:hypothetical protein